MRDSVVKSISLVVPRPMRETAREQWLADLSGADELGISRTSVISGAFRSSLTLRNRSIMETITHNRNLRIVVTSLVAIGLVVLVATLLPPAAVVAVAFFVITAGSVWIARGPRARAPRPLVVALVALVGLWLATTTWLWSSWAAAFDLSDAGQPTGSAGDLVVPLFFLGLAEFIAIAALAVVLVVKRTRPGAVRRPTA